MSVVYSVKKIVEECMRMVGVAESMENSIEAIQAAKILKDSVNELNAVYNNEYEYDKEKVERNLAIVERQSIVLECLIMNRDAASTARFNVRHEINNLEVSLRNRMEKSRNGKNEMLQFWIDYGCLQRLKEQAGHLLFEVDPKEREIMKYIQQEG